VSSQFQLPASVTRFNITGLTGDLSELIGVTVGVIGGAYIVHKSPSQSSGALISLIVGIIVFVLFPNMGLINGIGIGLAGYGLYQLIKLASNGAIL
jgi:hypothetical protein